MTPIARLINSYLFAFIRLYINSFMYARLNAATNNTDLTRKAIQVQHKAPSNGTGHVYAAPLWRQLSHGTVCCPFMAASATVWLLGIIIDTLASLSLSLSVTLPRSLTHTTAVSMQPLKLHALALAIIKLRHQSRWGSR